jgi:hypothetical protein
MLKRHLAPWSVIATTRTTLNTSNRAGGLDMPGILVRSFVGPERNTEDFDFKLIPIGVINRDGSESYIGFEDGFEYLEFPTLFMEPNSGMYDRLTIMAETKRARIDTIGKQLAVYLKSCCSIFRDHPTWKFVMYLLNEKRKLHASNAIKSISQGDLSRLHTNDIFKKSAYSNKRIYNEDIFSSATGELKGGPLYWKKRQMDALTLQNVESFTLFSTFVHLQYEYKYSSFLEVMGENSGVPADHATMSVLYFNLMMRTFDMHILKRENQSGGCGTILESMKRFEEQDLLKCAHLHIMQVQTYINN